MDMPTVGAAGDQGDIPMVWSHSKLLTQLGRLSEMLCNPAWAGGQQKGERALMVFMKSSSVSCVLKVETPPLSVSVSAPSFDDALTALEMALRSPQVPWRADTNPLGSGRKKKR